MITGNEMFTAIRSLLIDCVDAVAYPANTIEYGYHPAIGDNYINYWMIHSHKTGITTVKTYNGTEENKSSLGLFENLIQVDFYSDDPFTANDNCTNFNQYLSSFAMEYLEFNFPDLGLTIAIVDEIRNNTEVGDKATYLSRYTCRFSIFTHNEIIRPEVFFDEINILPDLIH